MENKTKLKLKLYLSDVRRIFAKIKLHAFILIEFFMIFICACSAKLAYEFTNLTFNIQVEKKTYAIVKQKIFNLKIEA